MAAARKETRFDGRIVMLGFGAIGQGVLPLLLRHIEMRPEQLEVISPSGPGADVVRAHGAQHSALRLDRGNYREALASRLDAGDFLLNLSVDVASKAVMELCQERRALYLDACTEAWVGDYTDRSVPPARRTNYALREDALSLRDRADTTAVITLGANPGLVSFFVKRALLELAGPGTPPPATREGWAGLARRLGVRTIHVAERDDQVGS